MDMCCGEMRGRTIGTYGGRIFIGRSLDAVKKFSAQSRHVHRLLSAESFDTVSPSIRALSNQSARLSARALSVHVNQSIWPYF